LQSAHGIIVCAKKIAMPGCAGREGVGRVPFAPWPQLFSLAGFYGNVTTFVENAP
jgi:hypothetical protein